MYVGWVGGRLSWLVVRPICFGPGGMLGTYLQFDLLQLLLSVIVLKKVCFGKC